STIATSPPALHPLSLHDALPISPCRPGGTVYLKQLQYVLEVATNGLSVTKAANKLNTSQPGVSQQIRSLENLLGIEIFTRDKNRDRKSTRLNSSHVKISYAVFCL